MEQNTKISPYFTPFAVLWAGLLLLTFPITTQYRNPGPSLADETWFLYILLACGLVVMCLAFYPLERLYKRLILLVCILIGFYVMGIIVAERYDNALRHSRISQRFENVRMQSGSP